MAYEMRISVWSSDVCSSDLLADSEAAPEQRHHLGAGIVGAFARFGDMDRPALVGGDPCRLQAHGDAGGESFGRAQCRSLSVFARKHHRPQNIKSHVLTPVTNALTVCRLLLNKKKIT